MSMKFEPPSKLERLLFRCMSYRLTRIHAHIVVHLARHTPGTITELAKGIQWDDQTTRNGCQMLQMHGIVKVTEATTSRRGSKRLVPKLTDLGYTLIEKSAETTPKQPCPPVTDPATTPPAAAPSTPPASVPSAPSPTPTANTSSVPPAAPQEPVGGHPKRSPLAD